VDNASVAWSRTLSLIRYFNLPRTVRGLRAVTYPEGKRRIGSTPVNSKTPSRLVPFRRWCEEVGISVRMGYREVTRGRLVVVKVGRRSYVRESDAEAWMQSLETLVLHGTSRHAQAHTEARSDEEGHEAVGSNDMEHPIRDSLPRAREGQDPDVAPWEVDEPPSRKVSTNLHWRGSAGNDWWPSDGELYAAYGPRGSLYAQAVRDWQRDRLWRDRAGLEISDRPPIPEDWLPPAEAMRMRTLGDPIQALRRKRGVS
jgi:hypothetical protein